MSVDREKGRVTLDHKEVPGYMPAMVMPFRVKAAWALEALDAGQTVQADLVVVGDQSWLDNISISSASGAPSLPSKVEGAVEPIVGTPATDFRLVNQRNEPVSMATYAGTVVVVTFIYTRCPLPDFCPRMSTNFSSAREALAREPKVASRTSFLSVSIDPEFDTPEVLSRYAERYASDGPAGPPRWDFLTGTAEQIRSLAGSYGLGYETDQGQIVHNLRTVVISPDGRISQVFRENDWTPDTLVDAIRQTLDK